MFGLFKKDKISVLEEQFVNDVAIVSSDLQDYCSFINGQDRQTLGERAIDNWSNRDHSDAHFTASDFYIDAFVSAIGQLTVAGQIDLSQSTNIYRDVTNFLDNYPKYNSEHVKLLMGRWEQYICDSGGGPIVYY